MYDALVDEGPLTPARIAARGFDRRTARKILQELGADEVGGTAAWLQVLHGNTWAIGPAAGHVLVFDCSWRKMTAALCDAHGEIIRHTSRAINLMPRRGAADSPRSIRADVRELTREVLAPNRPLLVGAAIVWPAPIPREPERAVRSGLRRHPWPTTDLRALFDEEIGKAFTGPTLPIAFYNDADAEALGEAVYGVGRGARNILLVKICEGIGAGLIVDCEIYEGGRGRAGELGHVVPAEIESRGLARHWPRCSCGADNHLECFASGRAIVHQFLRASETLKQSSNLSYEQCIALLRSRRDEHAVRSALDSSGALIGSTLRPLVHMLDPDRIIVSAEPDDAALLDSIIISLRNGAQIDGERVIRATGLAGTETSMSLRGGAHCAIRRYVVPRLRAGILGEAA